MQSKHKVLILGGAGFIGSNLAEHFYKNGSDVIVIDGLLKDTGGNKKNLLNLSGKIQIFYKKIEKLRNLQELLVKADLIIDCMAYTSHLAAIENPFYDYELNCKTHLHLIRNLKNIKRKNIIFLSSINVYGNSFRDKKINENSITNPVDVQGIHKLTAERYFNIYSKIYGFNVITLRIPNCFGKNQRLIGDDIGLVGSFIRDALQNKIIEIYGRKRKRSLIYIKDLVNIIYKISQKRINGYETINIPGYTISVLKLAEKIIKISGSGKILVKEIPNIVKNIDVGSAVIDGSKLTKLIGNNYFRNINDSLKETINYFKENLN